MVHGFETRAERQKQVQIVCHISPVKGALLLLLGTKRTTGRQEKYHKKSTIQVQKVYTVSMFLLFVDVIFLHFFGLALRKPPPHVFFFFFSHLPTPSADADAEVIDLAWDIAMVHQRQDNLSGPRGERKTEGSTLLGKR